MVNPVSPVLGYNNNVRHRNRVFHIQTEDSGVRHPHIVTHLFVDGGRIIKSLRTSYTEHLGADGLAETVRGMMKEQHKAMFLALRQGAFDDIIGASSGVPSIECVGSGVEPTHPTSTQLASSERIPEGPKSDGEELRLLSVEVTALPVVDASHMAAAASEPNISIAPEARSNMVSEPAPRKSVAASHALVAALAFPQVAIQKPQAAEASGVPSLVQVHSDAMMTMRPDIVTVDEGADPTGGSQFKMPSVPSDLAHAKESGSASGLGSPVGEHVQVARNGQGGEGPSGVERAHAATRAAEGDYAKTLEAAIFQEHAVAAPLTFDPALEHLILGFLTRNLGA